MLNACEVELPDLPKLQQQLLGLVWRGRKIDHQQGEHDDWANVVAGAVWSASRRAVPPRIRVWPYVDPDDPDYDKKVAEAWAHEREGIAARNSRGLSRPASGLSYYTGGDLGNWIRGG